MHAPFESFEALGSAARTEGKAAAVHFGTEDGLLCLERKIPAELLRGLDVLADAAAPFKAEAVLSRGGEEERLDTLTDPFVAASNNIPCSSLTVLEEHGGDFEGRRRAYPRWKRLSPNDQISRMQGAESIEALRWLKADVKRIAGVFAREVSSDPGCEGITAGKEEEWEEGGGGIDVTVKLELLSKGKCPRFHLDKVIKIDVVLDGAST